MSTQAQRDYQRGYAAGRARAKKDRTVERYRAERQAFLERAFLAALPATINGQAWTRGDKQLTTMADRTTLAWDFAEEALKKRRYTP